MDSHVNLSVTSYFPRSENSDLIHFPIISVSPTVLDFQSVCRLTRHTAPPPFCSLFARLQVIPGHGQVSSGHTVLVPPCVLKPLMVCLAGLPWNLTVLANWKWSVFPYREPGCPLCALACWGWWDPLMGFDRVCNPWDVWMEHKLHRASGE